MRVSHSRSGEERFSGRLGGTQNASISLYVVTIMRHILVYRKKFNCQQNSFFHNMNSFWAVSRRIWRLVSSESSKS
jgi:hypothetical protein